jgi:hypothetical protein
MDELDNYDLDQSGDYEDTTVGDVHESIETNMWLAEAYFVQGAEGLARECLRAAWHEYLRFNDILAVYNRSELGEKLRRLMLERCDDMLIELTGYPERSTPSEAYDRLAAIAA